MKKTWRMRKGYSCGTALRAAEDIRGTVSAFTRKRLARFSERSFAHQSLQKRKKPLICQCAAAIFPGRFAPGLAASLPVTNLLSPSSSISLFTIPFQSHRGKFFFLNTSKHFYRCKQAPGGRLQRPEEPLYLKAWRRGSPGPDPGPRPSE